MGNRFYLAICVVVALGVTAGCSSGRGPTQSPKPSESSNQEIPNWPPTLNEFRFHWSADPNIDLTTGPAVPIRAYLESYYVASFTADIANVYPGFMRSTPENDELDGHYLAQLAHIRPLNGDDAGPEDAREVFGYMPFHILRLDRVENGYRAIVCEGQYADFIKSDAQPGKFVSPGMNPKTAQSRGKTTDTVAVHRIELTDHDPRVVPNAPPSPTAPQQGPALAPDRDVFGNWFFTGASSSFWGPIDAPAPERIPSPELERQCSDRMPLPEADRLAMMTGFKDRPPPHGAATPGWPAKAQ